MFDNSGDEFNESFEFYYSTTGKEVTDFVKAGGDASVPEIIISRHTA
ncbi:hypothetical protein [Palleniella muris]|nr:hypothetical protein [Palleniella muris]